MSKTLLFLCTGNYYRSRFAEGVFNVRAEAAGLEWRAQSRGLSTGTGKWKVGPISVFALEALKQRGIRPTSFIREPLLCCEQDLCSADRVIALKDSEHRPLLNRQFPQHCPRIEFWHIHDIDVAHPDQALGELERLIQQLISRLSESPKSPGA